VAIWPESPSAVTVNMKAAPSDGAEVAVVTEK
jgi:hypothetical protein